MFKAAEMSISLFNVCEIAEMWLHKLVQNVFAKQFNLAVTHYLCMFFTEKGISILMTNFVQHYSSCPVRLKYVQFIAQCDALHCTYFNCIHGIQQSSGVRRKFSWGSSFSGIWWPFVFDVRCL